MLVFHSRIVPTVPRVSSGGDSAASMKCRIEKPVISAETEGRYQINVSDAEHFNVGLPVSPGQRPNPAARIGADADHFRYRNPERELVPGTSVAASTGQHLAIHTAGLAADASAVVDTEHYENKKQQEKIVLDTSVTGSTGQYAASPAEGLCASVVVDTEHSGSQKQEEEIVSPGPSGAANRGQHPTSPAAGLAADARDHQQEEEMVSPVPSVAASRESLTSQDNCRPLGQLASNEQER